MEHAKEVLQYLKKRGTKARAFEIVKGVSVKRRSVFKALKLLRKRGQVKHEGLHPKIYYSYISGLEEAPADKPKAAVPAQAGASKKQLSSPQTSSYQDLYNCENQLNKLQIALKSAQAMVNYQEDVIAELKARSDNYLKEMNRLRGNSLKPKGK